MKLPLYLAIACCVLSACPSLFAGEGEPSREVKQALFFHTSNTIDAPNGRRIAVDEQDRVYVLNYRNVWPGNKPAPNWNGGWMVYSADGEFLGEFWGITGGSGYQDISVMGGRIYAPCTWVGPQLSVFDANEGESLLTLPFNSPLSVAGAPDRSFWATNTKENRVDHFDQFGKLLGSIPAQNPRRVRVSPKDGRVYVEVPGSGVEAYSPDGKKEGMIPSGPLFNCTRDGNVISGFAIYTPKGEKVRDIVLGGFDKLGVPWRDLAADSKGNVYVAVGDKLGRLAFASYDARGNFRYARGADYEMMEAAIPSRVLEQGKEYSLAISFEDAREKGWVAPNQIIGSARGERPFIRAFIRDLSSGRWHDVGRSEGKFRLGEQFSGVATLRFTAAREPEPVGRNALHCDFLVAIPHRSECAPDAAASITVLTDRDRSAWRCGEDVPFYLVVRSRDRIADAEIDLRLTKGFFRANRAIRGPVEAGSTTLSFSVPSAVTSAFEPGDYLIGANLSMRNGRGVYSLAMNSRSVHIAQATDPKAFWRTHYPEVNEYDIPEETAVASMEVLARRGFNHDIRQAYSVASRREDLSMPGGAVPDADKLAPILAADPRLPPPEVLYRPHRFDRYLEAAARHGIDSHLQLIFNETMMPYLPEMLTDSQRQVQAFTQAASRHASFAGWCFTGHAHVESFAEPDASKTAMEKARADFTAKHGAPPGEKKREWFDQYNRFIPDTYAAWDKAALAVNPKLANSVSPGEFSSSAQGKYPPFIYDPFRFIITHIQEEQWHERTVYPFMTDLMRQPDGRGGWKPQISLHSMWQGAENGQYIGREYFAALTRGLQGAGISQVALSNSYTWTLPCEPYRRMHELFEVYGDLFAKLRPAHDVAILVPYEQQITPHGSPCMWPIFELYTTALYAHLPVRMIYEEEIATWAKEKPAPSRPRVLLIAGLKNELPPKVMAGIKAFQETRVGPRRSIFIDADTTVSIPGANLLGLGFDELRTMLAKTHCYWNSDSWQVRIDEVCLRKAPKLREAVEQVRGPLELDVDDPRCLAGLFEEGYARYLVIANTGVPPLKPETMWRFSMIEPHTFPARPMVSLRRDHLPDYEVYDLFAGRKAKTKIVNERIAFEADLTRVPGRVYALVKYPLGHFRMSAGIEYGKLHASVDIRREQKRGLIGPYPLVPLKFTLRDEQGNELTRIYRATGGSWGLPLTELPLRSNWPEGDLILEARELITGRGAKAVIKDWRPALDEPIRQAPDVEVVSGSETWALFHENRRFAIVREEAHADLKPAAELIAAGLAKGKKEVALLDAKAYLAAPDAFDAVVVPWLPSCRSPFFDTIDRLNSIPRRLSENWPGRGRGAVQPVHAARRYGEVVVIVAGGDVDGLAKAAKLVESPGRLSHAANADYSPPKLDKREPVTGRLISRSALPDRTAAFGPMFAEAAASPNGKYVALASLSWGNNLFVLDRGGKVKLATRGGKEFPSPLSATIGARPWLTMLDSGEVYARIADIEPPYLFLGRYADGKLVRRYAMMGLRHIGPADAATMAKSNDCNFAVSPDGTVVAAGNYGIAAFSPDGREVWRDDFTKGYATLESLVAKMTAEIAISADGTFLAVAKQREHNGWARGDWKPPVEASLRDLATGRVIWSCTFPKGTVGARVIATNGERILLQSGETLACLEAGKVAWQYEPPVVPRIYAGIHQPYTKAISRDASRVLVIGKEGSVILVSGGTPAWGERLHEGIFAATLNADSSAAAVCTADGLLVCYDCVSGQRRWIVQLPSHAALAFLGDRLVAADAAGVVHYFNAKGKEIETIDLRAKAERPDLAAEFAVPEDAPITSAPLPAWQESPMPDGTADLARAAKIEMKAPAGWYSSGAVENDPAVLNNGKRDDIDKPWLALHELYWDASAQRLPQVTITFDREQAVQALVVHEHPGHPEAVPREIAIEARQPDGTWRTVRTDLNVAGITHTHRFAPVTTTAVRYTIVADLFNNLWTTETEVH